VDQIAKRAELATLAASLECRAGTCWRFGRGSMIPIARLPISQLRSVGTGPLVLVAVSRAPLRATDEFRRDAGSYNRRLKAIFGG
jgi:hypothetical protein